MNKPEHSSHFVRLHEKIYELKLSSSLNLVVQVCIFLLAMVLFVHMQTCIIMYNIC